MSNALYGRRGLIPVTPLLAFSGVPAGARERLQPLDEADGALAAIDAAAYGFDRAVDHALLGADRAAHRLDARRCAGRLQLRVPGRRDRARSRA